MGTAPSVKANPSVHPFTENSSWSHHLSYVTQFHKDCIARASRNQVRKEVRLNELLHFLYTLLRIRVCQRRSQLIFLKCIEKLAYLVLITFDWKDRDLVSPVHYLQVLHEKRTVI